MTNNSKKPQGKKTPPVNQRKKILIFLGNWASEMSQVDHFEEHLELLKRLRRAYLESEWADDQAERNSAMLLFDHLENFFEGLTPVTEKDWRKVDRWILLANRDIQEQQQKMAS